MDTDSTEGRPKTSSDKEKLWCLGVSSPSAVLSVEVVINENKIKSALIKFLGFAAGRLTSNSRLRSLFQNCLSSNFKPLLGNFFFCLFFFTCSFKDYSDPVCRPRSNTKGSFSYTCSVWIHGDLLLWNRAGRIAGELSARRVSSDKRLQRLCIAAPLITSVERPKWRLSPYTLHWSRVCVCVFLS